MINGVNESTIKIDFFILINRKSQFTQIKYILPTSEALASTVRKLCSKGKSFSKYLMSFLCYCAGPHSGKAGVVKYRLWVTPE